MPSKNIYENKSIASLYDSLYETIHKIADAMKLEEVKKAKEKLEKEFIKYNEVWENFFEGV